MLQITVSFSVCLCLIIFGFRMADSPDTLLVCQVLGLSYGNGNGKAYGLQPEKATSVRSHLGGVLLCGYLRCISFFTKLKDFESTRTISPCSSTFLFSQTTLERFQGLHRELQKHRYCFNRS